MVALQLLLALTVSKTPAPAPLIPNGGWAASLETHPRLLGSPEHLRKLATEKVEVYREIRENQSLIAGGIVHTVEGIPAERVVGYLDKARRQLRRGVTNIHQDTWIWLTEVALTYDFFHEELSPDEREEIIGWLNGHLGVYTIDENAFHNSTLSKILCYLRVGYATWGENPRAAEWRDYALRTLYEGKVLPVLTEFGAGGGFTECGWYARSSLWHLVQALELARRMDGYDGFAQASAFFYERLAYEMFQPYPGLWTYGAERYPVEGDGASVYGGHNEYPRHLRTMLAQYYRGSDMSRFVANKRRSGSNFDARLVDFLYEEDPNSPLPLTDFPLAHLASGIGKVYARSDWTDDATWFRFECGDYWAGHQHFEVGNFEIFRYEPLATESGEYHDYLSNHSVNWLLRTVAHNCILVHEPGETWSNLRDGGRNPYANDGGQAKKWDWTVDTVDIWNRQREKFERGDIVAYQNRPEYLYVAGDCTAAYSPSKLQEWTRQIVFLRPHIFVIFDRVKSTRQEFAKTWLLHSRNAPVIEGNKFTIADGKGTLHVQTLLPETPRLTAIEGYAYGGETFDPPPTAHTQTANRWRVEVTHAEARTADVFLHVLSTDGEVSAGAVRENESIRVSVGPVEIIFREGVGGELAVDGKTFSLERHIVTERFDGK